MTPELPIKQRLRITFGKDGALKYTSNLDIAKVWERVLRRANLPILYTKGFNTRPRITLALALPLGISSECEILDVHLHTAIELDDVKERIEASSPSGLSVVKIDDIDPRAPTLQKTIRSAHYRITFIDHIPEGQLEEKVQALLDADRIIRHKVNKRKKRSTPYDLRSLVHDLTLQEGQILFAHLAVGDRGNLRPNELIETLELTNYHHHVHRYKIEFER